MNKLYKILLVSLFMFHASVAISGDAKLIDRVVALVDTDVVLGSELVRRTNSIIEQIKQRNQTVPPIDKLRDQVLDRLIVESLQIQMAKRVGVRISDAELDTTIAQVSQQNNQSVEQFRKDAVKDGTPWQLFREDIRREIMISRVRGGAVSRRIKVSDKEIDNLLAQINQQGLSRAQYSLGHILLPLAEGSSPEDVNEIRNLAQKLVSELRAGANFEEYAITYSKGQNALSGGGLGFRSLSQLPSLFAGSVKNMKAGDITEPLRSGSGLHILKLKEVKGGFETHSVIQTHVRHILVSPDAITDEQAAFEKIQLIRQRIQDGEKFEDLAIEFSDDKGSGSLGGDLKWSDPGTFVPPFTKAMDALAINELSEPVKTEFGWHIIEVLGRRDQDQTEDKKRERAYRMLHNRKFEEEAQLWIQELKDQAYIKILLEDA
ncbi:MAG: peptidylprolyl isomerase SurA [Kangiellaceae bacterium]|nr:peptidylprolyl isomerase SurA [Kangiellaceae bacterium]MCW8998490.1 peptidylprolyl isomerase SurA [Kangiellaceae bacterium]